MNKPQSQDLSQTVAALTGMPGEAPEGLADRLRGTDLDKPSDILRAAWVLMSDLNHVLAEADKMAAQFGAEPICPGLARHKDAPPDLHYCNVTKALPNGKAIRYTSISRRA